MAGARRKGGRPGIRQTPPTLWGPQGHDRSQEEGVVRSSPAATKRVHQTRAHGGIKMNRTIEIIIGTTGEIQIDAVGFKGPDCEKATRFLEEALGVLCQKIKKPEYHQRTTTSNQQRMGR